MMVWTTSDPQRPLYHWKARRWSLPAANAHATYAHGDGRYTRRDTRTFFLSRWPRCSAVGAPCGAVKVAGDALAAYPSRHVEAAALRRRHSRLGRRLAAPRRLAAAGSTSGSSERSESSTNSARTELQSAEEMPATSVPATVVTVVGIAGLYSSRSNAGQREGCAAAGSAAASDDIRQGKVDAAQRAARQTPAEHAPEAAIKDVPPIASDVLRRPARPPQASGAQCCETTPRTHKSAGRARVHCCARRAEQAPVAGVQVSCVSRTYEKVTSICSGQQRRQRIYSTPYFLCRREQAVNR